MRMKFKLNVSPKLLAMIAGVLLLVALIPTAIAFADNSDVTSDDSVVQNDSNSEIVFEIHDKSGNPIPLENEPYVLFIGLRIWDVSYDVDFAWATKDAVDNTVVTKDLDSSYTWIAYAGAEGYVNGAILVDSGVSPKTFKLSTGRTCHFDTLLNPGLSTTILKAGSSIKLAPGAKPIVIPYDIDLQEIVGEGVPIGFPEDGYLTFGTWYGADTLNYHVERADNITLNINFQVKANPGYHFYGWQLNGWWAWGPRAIKSIPGPSFLITPVFETDFVEVTGRVLNNHYMPIPFARVNYTSDITGISYDAYTDFYGNYEIWIPRFSEGHLTYSKGDKFFEKQIAFEPFSVFETWYVTQILSNNVDVLFSGFEGHSTFNTEYYVNDKLKDSANYEQIDTFIYKSTVVTYGADGTIVAEYKDDFGNKHTTKVKPVAKDGYFAQTIMVNGVEFVPGSSFVVDHNEDLNCAVSYAKVGPEPGPVPPSPVPPVPGPVNPDNPGAQTGDGNGVVVAGLVMLMMAMASCAGISLRRKQNF